MLGFCCYFLEQQLEKQRGCTYSGAICAQRGMCELCANCVRPSTGTNFLVNCNTLYVHQGKVIHAESYFKRNGVTCLSTFCLQDIFFMFTATPVTCSMSHSAIKVLTWHFCILCTVLNSANKAHCSNKSPLYIPE